MAESSDAQGAQDLGAAAALAAAGEALSADPALAQRLASEALARDPAPDGAARALLLIGRAEYGQGRTAEALPWLERARDGFAGFDEREGTVECLLALGRVRRDMGAFAEAAEALEEALVLASDAGQGEAEADALNLLAGVYDAQGESVRALGCLERALDLVRDLELPERQANVLSNIGLLHTALGDYPNALENLKAGFELLQAQAPTTRSLATNLIGLGHLYSEMGDAGEARVFFGKARDLGREAGDPVVEAAALNNLANVHRRSEEWGEAEGLFGEALALARELGQRQYEIDNLDGLGQVQAALGRHGAAADLHAESLAGAREIGDSEGELDALLNLGRDLLALGRIADAREVLQSGLELAAQLDRKRPVFEAHELLSVACERSGDPDGALYHHREFHRAEKAVFNEESEKKRRKLAVQFELERARYEAEEYRLRTDLADRARDEAEAMVRERTRELEEAQLEVVARLAVAAEYRDDATGEHTRRVGRNAASIAYALGWPRAEVQLLYSAARLHDVGKIGIRDAILLKPARLSAEEIPLMETHTTIGARILSAGRSRLLRMAEEIALSHHERWDGKGYPFGLAGKAIPRAARIVAVADVLDALTHERPYKRSWTVASALREIQRQRGRQFDPQAVDACLQLFGPEGELSPLEAPMDWPATVAELDGLDIELPPAAKWGPEEREGRPGQADAPPAAAHEATFTDPLTGLGNRRAFETDLALEVARATRRGGPVSLLAFGLESGAAAGGRGDERGDALLRTLAKAVDLQLEGLGQLYRVAGGDFVVVLAGIGRDRFAEVLERLRQSLDLVRAAGFPRIAVSTGLAAFPEEAERPIDLVRMSEERLQRDRAAAR